MELQLTRVLVLFVRLLSLSLKKGCSSFASICIYSLKVLYICIMHFDRIIHHYLRTCMGVSPSTSTGSLPVATFSKDTPLPSAATGCQSLFCQGCGTQRCSIHAGILIGLIWSCPGDPRVCELICQSAFPVFVPYPPALTFFLPPLA